MLRILVIGCGGISARWLKAVTTGTQAEICGLVDIKKENAERRAAEFGLKVPVFTEIAKAIEAVKPDAAAVLTPPDMHLPAARECLEAGIDVLSEKPLSDSIEHAREILRLSKETGKRVLVMQNRRYLSGIRKAREILSSGMVGDVTMVHAEMLLGAHFGQDDFRYHMEHPLLLDMLVHTFDEARYLLGDRQIVSAYCQEFNPKDSWYDHEAGAVCIFETADGAVISIRGSWVSHAENTPSHSRWHIGGTKGALLWDGREQLILSKAQPVPQDAGYFEEEGLRETLAVPKLPREEHDGCIDAMLKALREGTPLDTECFENIHTLEMVFACLTSAGEGRKVWIGEAT